MKSFVSVDDVAELGNREIPFVELIGYRIETIEFGVATVSAPYTEKYLRPGGTISGPVLMGLADYCAFAAVLSRIGLVPMAVTTNLNINFLTRPAPGDVVATATVLKLGRRLAVCDVLLHSAGAQGDPVAHVTVTYSLPPGIVPDVDNSNTHNVDRRTSS